jgi:hypothetical protein
MSDEANETMSEQDIIAWQREKRAEWMRDKQLIAEGKLRPEDLSLAHGIMSGSGNSIDFSRFDALLKRDEEDAAWADD